MTQEVSGLIGSWVVHLLLERGYFVHATIQDPRNWKETKHLEVMEWVKEILKLFIMYLMDCQSIQDVIDGCVGVFHLAIPNTSGRSPKVNSFPLLHELIFIE